MGGPLVKNLLSKAGYIGWIPGGGTKIPQARGQLTNPTLGNYWWIPRTTPREACSLQWRFLKQQLRPDVAKINLYKKINAHVPLHCHLKNGRFYIWRNDEEVFCWKRNGDCNPKQRIKNHPDIPHSPRRAVYTSAQATSSEREPGGFWHQSSLQQPPNPHINCLWVRGGWNVKWGWISELLTYWRTTSRDVGYFQWKEGQLL